MEKRYAIAVGFGKKVRNRGFIPEKLKNKKLKKDDRQQ